jgi:ABC-2 type transport system permease protein
MFKIVEAKKNDTDFSKQVHEVDASFGIIIPADFSANIKLRAKNAAGKALNSFGLDGDSATAKNNDSNIFSFYYKPSADPSFKISVQSALSGALQMVESRQVLKNIYYAVNEKQLPDSLEDAMLSHSMVIKEIPLSKHNDPITVNSSQHNVPSWTIFAMFFVVMSLSPAIVREKINGSFIRLKTLPTNYVVAIFSKQITYLFVTLIQASLIFAIGAWLFPYFGLPPLHFPADRLGLLLVTLVCGWCAVSYAICVGVFAKTQEQANGFGAISIVILAIIGGLMIPDFIMPSSFKNITSISPLHWCLQAYYNLFLEGGSLKDILANIISLLVITVIIQLITFVGLKRKKLI